MALAVLNSHTWDLKSSKFAIHPEETDSEDAGEQVWSLHPQVPQRREGLPELDPVGRLHSQDGL